MVSTQWSIALGRGDSARMFVTRSGRVVVSTHNPYRCQVIEPSGEVMWVRSGINARCEEADGVLVVAGHDDCAFLACERDGRALERRQLAPPGKRVVGWRGTQPIFSGVGYCWVDPFVYALRDNHLHRYDTSDQLLAKVPLPEQPFRDRLMQRGYTSIDAILRFTRTFVLCYRASRHRLLAFDAGVFGWTMSLRLDGSVEWLALPVLACCNSVCFIGDEVTVHASSCGGCVSFLAVDGTVIRRHEIAAPWVCANDRAVFAIGNGTVRAFDGTGEPMWKLDVADVETSVACGPALYTLARAADGLALTAYCVA